MEINGNFGIHGVHGARQVGKLSATENQGVRATDASVADAPSDQVDFSAAAQSIGQVAGSGAIVDGVRVDKVAALKAQIAAGTYDTPERMAVALDRMLDQWG
jgi:flagellar biosynthesis anti-sigma factor FlgM